MKFQGKIIKSIPSSGGNIRALYAMGEYLWAIDQSASRIRQLWKEDGSIVREIPMTMTAPGGMAFIGDMIMVLHWAFPVSMYLLSSHDFSVLGNPGATNIGTGVPYGLHVRKDGDWFMLGGAVAPNGHAHASMVNLDSPARYTNVRLNSSAARRGTASDGQNLYGWEDPGNHIVLMSAHELEDIETLPDTHGLTLQAFAHDGDYLYAVDNGTNLIYQIM